MHYYYLQDVAAKHPCRLYCRNYYSVVKSNINFLSAALSKQHQNDMMYWVRQYENGIPIAFFMLFFLFNSCIATIAVLWLHVVR